MTRAPFRAQRSGHSYVSIIPRDSFRPTFAKYIKPPGTLGTIFRGPVVTLSPELSGGVKTKRGKEGKRKERRKKEREQRRGEKKKNQSRLNRRGETFSITRVCMKIRSN